MMSATYPENAVQRRSGDAGSKEPHRNAFAKDRDRLLYAAAFRRLAGKSQVVASTELGPFHTRLTHSIKVAQLGRRIAEQFRSQGMARRSRSKGRPPNAIAAPDPDLVEFACLAHDIGHPPFGHTGEWELHRTVEDILDKAAKELAQLEGNKQKGAGTVPPGLGGFEGNPQSFRVVTRIASKWLPTDGSEVRDTPCDWYGLDLTAASMDAVSKYPWGRESSTQMKWGVYGTKDDDTSDYASLLWARGETQGTVDQGAAKSFECALMDWCDSVTYAVHDLEDFFQIGMIPLHLIFSSGSDSQGTYEWQEFRDYFQNKKSAENGKNYAEDDIDKARQALLHDMDGLVVWGPFNGSARDRRYAHNRSSKLIEHFVKGLRYDGDPLLHNGKLLLDKDPAKADALRLQCDLLKELIWKYVIKSPSLVTQQAGQRRIIRDLITFYYEDESLLPPYYQEMIEADARKRDGSTGLDAVCSRLRSVADYVSSLTEPHAIALHKRLTGSELGGFRDLV